LTQPLVVTMIGVREHTRKRARQSKRRTIDVHAGFDGRTESIEGGRDELVECGFTKGRDTFKRHDV